MHDSKPDRSVHGVAEPEGETAVRALLESAGQGILGVDSSGNITLVNLMAERQFGYSREELLGQPVETLLPERLRGRHVAHRADYFSEPHVRPMGQGLDLTGRRKDGSEFPVEISLSYITTRSGIWAISFITDITERKKAEQISARQAEELARSNADLQQFAYVVSHDLQEPLRNISGFAELLNKRYADSMDPQGQEFVRYILTGTDRMTALINDLLAYSRVTNATNATPFVSVDLNEVAAVAASNMRLLIADSQAAVRRAQLPTVMGDKMQLMQVFQNLISNAIKYRSESVPEISIDAEPTGDNWVISISDNGVGIQPQYRDRVFGLFKRLHGRDYPGTGVGLAICKKVIERHGGKIWVEANGAGTTVKFTLRKAFALPG